MLYMVDVKEEKLTIILAITHIVGTGRLQMVNGENNPCYYQLIKQFGEATGVQVILNTSFYLKDRPIVNTSYKAFSIFSRCGMDVLVLDHCVI